MKKRLSTMFGFTLVELLIVIGIIGVLATAGIPTYQWMVQKSRKVEATTLLGALYQMEAVFYAEHGCYGNNLIWMPFYEMAETSPSFYTVGFPDNECGTGLQGGVIPKSGTELCGPIVYAAIPTYGDRVIKYYLAQRLTVKKAYCLKSYMHDMFPTSYKATASGVIAPWISPNTKTPSEIDQWQINDQREVINVVDGIQ